jgi:cyanophycinase
MFGNLVVLAALLLGQAEGSPRGQLVIVGGGPDNAVIYQRLLTLAGGKKARIVVVPYASGDPTAGDRTAQSFRDNGAENIDVVNEVDPEKAMETIRSADLIWMRGGSQARLMDALSKHSLAPVILDRYRKGAIVAGTSAGAAVMSSAMIAGNAGRRGTPEANSPTIADGLGLWPEVIVDQHFVKRNRLKRLEAAVRRRPELVGVGIDESTAVVVSGRGFEVIGAGSVIVIDGRKVGSGSKDKDKDKDKGPSETIENLAEFTLKPGMKFDLDKGPVAVPPMPAETAMQETSPP